MRTFVEMSAHYKVGCYSSGNLTHAKPINLRGDLYQGEGRLQCFERALGRPFFCAPCGGKKVNGPATRAGPFTCRGLLAKQTAYTTIWAILTSM